MRQTAFRRVRKQIAGRLFLAKPVFQTGLLAIMGHVDTINGICIANTQQHTYHSLEEYVDIQVRLPDTV
jgi:hypothetical protein